MPLTIQLDDPRPCYFGNETIRGRVLFESSTVLNIQDIRVTFTGVSKAKVQKVKGAGAPAANYRSKCVLFEKEKILLHLNGAALSPGTYEWPFEFIFPSAVLGSSKWTQSPPFRSDAGHPLPPTFAIETGDESRKVKCGIDYLLQARISKPQGGIIPTNAVLFVEELRLKFIPDCALSDGHDSGDSEIYRQQKEQIFNISSMLLLPENRGRTLSMQEKLQSWVFPSQLPRFSFTALFSYPTRVVQGSPLRCLLEITPHIESSSITSSPDIVVKSISLTVNSQTAARASPSLIGAMSAVINDRIDILSKTGLHIPVTGVVDVGELFGSLLFKHTDVSFSTFNISRQYRLGVKVVFECAGKTSELSFSDLFFDVVADYKRPEKKNPAFESLEAVEDAPPSYTPGDERRHEYTPDILRAGLGKP